MPFNPTHLDYLRGTIVRGPDGRLPPQQPVGHVPKTFAENIGAGAEARELPKEQMTRDKVAAFCADLQNSALSCFLAVMAWGAMRHDHGRTAFGARRQWADEIQRLRTSPHMRLEAYDLLQGLRAANRLPGVGPAYFTKLIHFFPKSDGYIMDQWLARSINLLTGKPVVPVVRTINRKTDNVAVAVRLDVGGQVYETFCGLVDKLAGEFDMTGEETERLLFSQGGRHPGAWREYVRTQDLG